MDERDGKNKQKVIHKIRGRLGPRPLRAAPTPPLWSSFREVTRSLSADNSCYFLTVADFVDITAGTLVYK